MDKIQAQGESGRPVRVLILDNEFHMGGSEKKLFDFIRLVDRERVHVSVCCLKEGGYFREELVAIGVPFYENLLRNRFDASAFFRLNRVLRVEKPDIVYTMTHPNTVLLAWLARSRGLIGHFVVSFHAMGNDRGGRLVPHYLLPFLFDADALLAVAATHRRYLADREGLPERQIQVIYNGVDTARYHPGSDGERTAARRAIGRSDGDVVMTVVASLKPLKQQGLLLRAAAATLRERPDVHVVMAGDGPDRAALESAAQALGIADQAHFLGIRGDIDVVLRASDALVLSSRTEVFPNVVLEAMATGLPVLSTDVGCVREMVEVDESALVVPAGDTDALAAAFARLAGDADLRRRFGSRGREIVEARFPIERMCSEREELFARLAGN